MPSEVDCILTVTGPMPDLIAADDHVCAIPRVTTGSAVHCGQTSLYQFVTEDRPPCEAIAALAADFPSLCILLYHAEPSGDGCCVRFLNGEAR